VIARLAIATLAVALGAQAQMAPRPFLSKDVRMQVVDAETGRPVQGAIVVGRWSWLAWYPGGLHSSARSVDEGEALHIAEDVTDADGRFTLEGFGPTVRSKGSLEEKAPSLTVYARDYEPFQKNVGEDRQQVRLKRHAGSGADLAAKIAAIQGDGSRGLHWLSGVPAWKSMPRMVQALHREKIRLGGEGAQVRGAHRLAGLTGAGSVVDAATGRGVQAADKLPGEPYARGAVWTAWTMRRVDGGPGTLRLTYSRTLEPGESASPMVASPWIVPGPDSAVPGWEAVKDVPPQVRVYAWGYRRSPEMRWTDAGSTVKLERIQAQRERVLENVRALRRDIDAELAGDRAQAIQNHRPLLALLAAECRALTPDLRAGACFPEGSDVAVELARRDVYGGRFDGIPEDGPSYSGVIGSSRAVARIEAPRVEVAPGGAARIQAQSPMPATIGGGGSLGVAHPAQGPLQRKPVGGFSIEPAK
jgi:hypothetical protein